MVEKLETHPSDRGGCHLPDSLLVESEPYSSGWRIVKELNGYGLDRTMSQAGWTCFFIARLKSAPAQSL